MDIEEFIAAHQRRRQYAEEDDSIPAWLAKERVGNPLLVTTDSAALSGALEAQVARWRNRDDQTAQVLPLRQLNMAALGQGEVVYGAASILGAFDGLLAGLLDNSHTGAARNAYDTAYQSLGASIRLSKIEALTASDGLYFARILQDQSARATALGANVEAFFRLLRKAVDVTYARKNSVFLVPIRQMATRFHVPWLATACEIVRHPSLYVICDVPKSGRNLDDESPDKVLQID